MELIGKAENIEWSLEVCIQILRNLPDHYLHPPGIAPDWGDRSAQGNFLRLVRKSYAAHALWLEYYLLDRTEHEFELTRTDKKHYKPLAERSRAVLKLAQEVWLDSPLKSQIPSPGFWMLGFEICLLETALKNSGYLGQPRPIGKTEHYREFVKATEKFKEPTYWRFGEPIIVNARDALISEALRLASDRTDSSFNTNHWEPFLKTVRRVERQIKQSKLNGIYLTKSGELKVIREGKQPRKKSFS